MCITTLSSRPRIVEKPWKADAYMTNVIDMFIRGKGSIAQQIQYSDVWSEEYNNNLRAMEDNPVSDSNAFARNLRTAKHRIESMSLPMGRCVIYLQALIATSITIAVRRKGLKEAKLAAEFLHWVDEEACLQLAMIADAGAEGWRFKGFWDSENTDPARSAAEIERYRRVCHSLFVDMNVVQVGFTAYMLQILRKPILIPEWATGSAKTLGSEAGVDLATIQRCLARMQCFVSMSMSVLQAEFPSWEILQSFAAFDLSDSGRTAHQQRRARRCEAFHEWLKRLASCFDVPYNELLEQCAQIAPIAEGYRSQGHSNLESWRLALKRASDRRVKYPVKSLREVLIRYASLSGCSTQGQESAFSVQTHLLRPQRNHMLPEAEQTELKLAIDLKPEQVQHRVKAAQALWAKLYGKVRRPSSTARLDKGTTKKHKRATRKVIQSFLSTCCVSHITITTRKNAPQGFNVLIPNAMVSNKATVQARACTSACHIRMGSIANAPILSSASVERGLDFTD